MENKAKLTAIAAQFLVPDVVATAEYYRDKLGFKILGYFADPPVYAMVSRDVAEIHFGEVDDVPSQSNSVRRSISCDAYIWTDDLNALFEELTARGADIVEGPIKRIYGSTEFTVRDCDDHIVVFGD